MLAFLLHSLLLRVAFSLLQQILLPFMQLHRFDQDNDRARWSRAAGMLRQAPADSNQVHEVPWLRLHRVPMMLHHQAYPYRATSREKTMRLPHCTRWASWVVRSL